jgi:hypothetical protein
MTLQPDRIPIETNDATSSVGCEFEVSDVTSLGLHKLSINICNELLKLHPLRGSLANSFFVPMEGTSQESNTQKNGIHTSCRLSHQLVKKNRHLIEKT